MAEETMNMDSWFESVDLGSDGNASFTLPTNQRSSADEPSPPTSKGGTCTIAQSDPSEMVIHRAMYLLQNGFVNYDVFENNCEDFAIYCKTEFGRGVIRERKAPMREEEEGEDDVVVVVVRKEERVRKTVEEKEDEGEESVSSEQNYP
ncbi:hypothetical protein Droror1_Dr00020184, partial [Drosera rotundifolia]